MTITMPGVRPLVPHFSSGPCAKRPGWSLQALTDAALGRSHRAKLGRAKLKRAIDLTREVLEVPASHRIGIVPASDTGAVEMALWSLLGARPVTMLAWESFGEGWVTDVLKELKLKDATRPQGAATANCRISPRSTGRTTSSSLGTARRRAFGCRTATGSQPIARASRSATRPRPRSPRRSTGTSSMSRPSPGRRCWAAKRPTACWCCRRARWRGLKSHKPAWPLPKIFRLTKGGKLNEGIFEGETINTPSMLCVEDYLDALQWAKSIGGLKALMARADANTKVISNWVARTPWIEFLAADPAIRSNTSVCLKVVDPAVTSLSPDAQSAFAKALAGAVEKEGAGYDLAHYRDAPAGLRIWCGATVEAADVEVLTQWLDWAFAKTKDALPKAA